MKKYIGILFLVFVLVLAGCANKGEKQTFEATILEVGDTYLLVEPSEGTPARRSADKISVGTSTIKDKQSLKYLAEAQVGDVVKIGYRGGIAESYPAQIHNAYEIKLVTRAEAP